MDIDDRDLLILFTGHYNV